LSISRTVFALEPIEFSVVDPSADAYGTFESHNQKVISNQYGIFTSSLRGRTEAFTNNTWLLSRSTDGGKTFSVVYSAANAIHTPAIETDPNGVIYASTFSGADAVILKFDPANNYKSPISLAQLPSGSAQKFAMILDWQRKQIYYACAHTFDDFRFYVIKLDGTVSTNKIITVRGSSGQAHYPHLTLDESNTLYLGWTTVNNANLYLYWDIHFMMSKDGGQNWEKPNGAKLSIPVVADETGPTDEIVPSSEFPVNTWLWNMVAKNGKINLPYTAQIDGNTWNQHYVRYDLATAKIDLNISPKWGGRNIFLNNSNGFCTTKLKDKNFPLYCISRSGAWRLYVIVSYDNGTTWNDYAQSDFNTQNIYAIGGAREITSDGYIIGTYTDVTNTQAVVRFFRIKATETPLLPVDLKPPNSYWPMDEVSGINVMDKAGLNNGTTTSSIINGKFGKARNFNGTSDFIQIQDTGSLSFGNGLTDIPMTMSIWVYPRTLDKTTGNWIINKRGAGILDEWQLAFWQGKVSYMLLTNSSNYITQTTNTVWTPGQWYHIVAEYDGSKKVGGMKLYVNDVLQPTTEGVVGTYIGMDKTVQPVTIGKPGWTSAYYFDGIIDDVQIITEIAPTLTPIPTLTPLPTPTQIPSTPTTEPTVVKKIGDINNDGEVNLADYNILTPYFHSTAGTNISTADLNKDGVFDIFDYNTLIEHFEL
jgi:hypothetical protein